MQLVCWLGPESLSAQTCNFLGSLCTFPEPRSLPRFPFSYEVKHQKSVQCDRALMTYLEKSNNSICQSSGFSLGTPVSPSPQKPLFLNINLTRNQVDDEPLSGCAIFNVLFIYLFICQLQISVVYFRKQCCWEKNISIVYC